MTTHGLLCYCRPGFEPELAAELTERAAAHGLGGYARTERNSGYVVFVGEDGDALTRALPFDALIFARQKLRLIVELRGLDPKDRITPMIEALCGRGFSPDEGAASGMSGLVFNSRTAGQAGT